MANYNSLALLFVILGILINIKQNKNCFLQGVIIFLIFMSKQNMGIYYIIGLGLNLLFNYKLNKDEILNFIKYILVFIGLFSLYLIYLYFDNNLYNFINFCFLGIGEFSNNITFSKSSKILLTILFFILAIILNIFAKKVLDKELIKKINIMQLISIPMILTAYPIFNEAHITTSFIYFFIEFMCLLDVAIIKDILNEKIKKIIIFLLIFGLLINSGVIFIKYLNNIFISDYPDEVFFGGIFSTEIEENINNTIDKNIINVCNYINNCDKDVVVLSHYAKLYSLVLNNNHGIFDLPFYGNLGVEGEDGLIKKISELKDTNILIVKEEENMIHQESIKARDYIKNNFKLVGEIEQFYIYEIN